MAKINIINKPKKHPKMRKLVQELRDKKDKIIHHKGIIKIEKIRIYNKLKESPIAKEHPTEFIKGSECIKQILLYKQNNQLLYTTGKLAPYVLKKFPELNTPEVVRSILIATGNPKLELNDINNIVSEMFDTTVSEDARKGILFSLIRSINKKNYGYLVD
ncbi:MAG: hypothetical protein WCF78_00895 [archaeon]